MIHTVFSTSVNAAMQWQSELLELSWRRVKQPGELVRLVAAEPDEPLPRHRCARVVATLAWSPHPYTGDRFAPYNRAASVLEWLFRERIDGTVLLLDPDCIFRAPIEKEVSAGQALATPWPDLPRTGEDPFGLGPDFAFLHQFCVNRSLRLQQVTLPILIHSRDLRKIAARWLELTGIIRSETGGESGGQVRDADRIAYAIAAAEAEILHEPGDVGVEAVAADNGAPIVHYRRALESERGEIVWDKKTYRPWERPDPERARSGPGRDLLAVLKELVLRREGGDLALLHPKRRRGVREARVLDRMVLQIPSRSGEVTLNSSAAAIWELCDGRRNLADIVRELEARFQATAGALRGDVEATSDQLENVGALDLDLEPS